MAKPVNRKANFVVFIGISIVGFVSAMYFNGLAVMNKEDYLAAWSGSAAVSVLTWDLSLVAIAAAIFMVLEARRIGMKRVWVYIVLSGFTAMACSFPLFLAMRERHLAKTEVAK